MSKVSGSTASLVRGVSQQVPQDRQLGQHTEVLNMLPDPVEGLTRRHGSKMLAEKVSGLSPAQFSLMLADTDTWRSTEFSNNLHDYTVLYRSGARPVGSTLPPILVYDRTENKFLGYVRPGTDADLDKLEADGISAITAVGKFLYLAGNTVVPTIEYTQVHGSNANKETTAVWVRGGAYAQEFKAVCYMSDSSVKTISYTTPTSSYPGTLDTSKVPTQVKDPAGGTQTDTEGAFIRQGIHNLYWGAWNPTSLSATKAGVSLTVVSSTTPAVGQIGWPAGSNKAYFHSSYEGAIDILITYTHDKTVTNPAYSSTVTMLTNEYNSAVTKWIGEAAEKQTATYIATQLYNDAISQGMTATLVDTTVMIENCLNVTVSDGGAGELIRGVANSVRAVDQLTVIHKIGKVVKVQAERSEDSFYMKALPLDGVSVTYGKVTWVEGAGEIQTVKTGILMGTRTGDNFALASTPSALAGVSGTGVPDYVPSGVGDGFSSPKPFFIDRKITYLGVFQDRLMVGSGAVLRASRTGDYLNFFRTSLLTVVPDDSFEMLSQGSDDDTLHHGVLYDRDLVLFGEKRQYVVSGRVTLTPTSANMPVMSSHADASGAPPLAVGGYIVFGKAGEGSSEIDQVQPGLNVESPEAFSASSQVNTFIAGKVIELSNHSKPTHWFVRTTGHRYGLFVFTYLDRPGQERSQDAWHKWSFGIDVGPVIGMQRTADGLLVFHIRVIDGKVLYAADLVPMSATLSKQPYLDSWRPASAQGQIADSSTGDIYVAFDDSSEWFLLGDTLANKADLLAEFPLATGPTVGYGFPAAFTPTNPFVRDRNDKAITTGLLTITKLVASIKQSSGFWADMTARGATASQEYNGRIVGDLGDLVGREVIVTTTQSVPIGHETRDYTLRFRARRWLPLTLTALEWVGQFFNRTQRF